MMPQKSIFMFMLLSFGFVDLQAMMAPKPNTFVDYVSGSDSDSEDDFQGIEKMNEELMKIALRLYQQGTFKITTFSDLNVSTIAGVSIEKFSVNDQGFIMGYVQGCVFTLQKMNKNFNPEKMLTRMLEVLRNLKISQAATA